MEEEKKEKLPLELLKEKYYPIAAFPEKFGVSVPEIMRLLNDRKIRRAEFKVPGERRRTLHVNYEEVFTALGRDIPEEENR